MVQERAPKIKVLRAVSVFVAIFSFLLCIPVAVAPAPGVQPTLNINSYRLPQIESNPWVLTAGPDGAIWYTVSCAGTCTPSVHDAIGRITAKGAITEYPLPGPSNGNGPYGITAGPDGALWFTRGNKIGRITTAGVITEYPLPTSKAGPYAITSGPDGAIWFTESAVNKIGRMTTTGVVTEYSVGWVCCSTDPTSIVAGPDGALWFTNINSPWIGRISTQGDVTKYPIPAQCSGITVGADGALWFTCGDPAGALIGRITTDGIFKMYSVPTKNTGLGSITLGPDNALWFTEFNSTQIGRVTTEGVFTEYSARTDGGSNPYPITTGPDGAVWFGTLRYIAQILVPKFATATALVSSLNPSIYGQKVTWAAMVTTSGSVPPTGAVAFRWSNSGRIFTIGRATLNASGVATLTRSNLNADPFGVPYPIVAVYSGDTVNLGSTSGVLSQHVLQTKTAATIASSVNPSTQGQVVAFTATITSPTVTPTGPVTFTVGKQVLGTAQIVPWTHKATLAISTLPFGSAMVTVTYLGDSNIAKSSASLTQTVQ